MLIICCSNVLVQRWMFSYLRFQSTICDQKVKIQRYNLYLYLKKCEIFHCFSSIPIQDLHRTGCSSYCGQEAEQDRVVLKRVLLAYARWNKSVGYCQGFNILAALILEVVEGNEGDALKVSISVDHIFIHIVFCWLLKIPQYRNKTP